MPISESQYLEMQARIRKPDPKPSSDAAERETGHGGLQEQIRDHCRAQWPEWLVIQARPDKKSTIAEGAQDFTIFLPGCRLLCGETKAKGGKRTPEQLAWAIRMERLGHKVHLWYNMDDFLKSASEAMKP